MSSTPATLSVAVALAKASVIQSQPFSVKVTIANTGRTVVDSVTPTIDQATGQIVQAKYYSPTIAAIAPGKNVTFRYTVEELVTGVFTLSADAQCPFANSTGAATATISVTAKTVGATAITDDSGNAMLKSGKSVVPIQIVDRNTGEGISGLTVAIEPENKLDTRALVVITDSQGRYPMQMEVLQGSTAGSVKPALLTPAVASGSGPTSIDVSSGATSALSAAIGAIQTTFLPAYTGQTSATGFTGAFDAALKALASSRLPLPVAFGSDSTPKVLYNSGTIEVPESLTRLSDITSEFVKTATVGEIIMGGLELATAGEISLPLAAVMLTADFSFATVNNLLFDETDAQSVSISVVSDGGIPYILVTPQLPKGDSSLTFTPQDPVADVTIDPTSGGKPITGGSYELISKDDLANNIVGVLDPSGSTSVPVELGDYTLQVNSTGDGTYTDGSLTVGKNGATIKPTLTPEPIASGSLTTPVGQATGFLDNGAQFYLTPHFYDANGKEITPTGPVYYQVHNPVGAVVATVNPTTGLVTMGPGFGAALITAWYNGFTTTSKLVSTNGNGKYPAQPSVPFAVSPTLLHFQTQQGSNPPSQSFNVVGLSSKFTNFHYTNKNGWLSVAPANVANFNVFTVSVDASGLTPGSYALPMTISDDATGYKQTIIATLTVTMAPPVMAAGTFTGNWNYPVFGFGEDYSTLTWNLTQNGNNLSGTYSWTILDGSVDTTGEVNNGTFYGTIVGNSITLTSTGGTTFNATITGNTITGTSNYLQANSNYTLTAKG